MSANRNSIKAFVASEREKNPFGQTAKTLEQRPKSSSSSNAKSRSSLGSKMRKSTGKSALTRSNAKSQPRGQTGLLPGKNGLLDDEGDTDEVEKEMMMLEQVLMVDQVESGSPVLDDASDGKREQRTQPRQSNERTGSGERLPRTGLRSLKKQKNSDIERSLVRLNHSFRPLPNYSHKEQPAIQGSQKRRRPQSHLKSSQYSRSDSKRRVKSSQGSRHQYDRR